MSKSNSKSKNPWIYVVKNDDGSQAVYESVLKLVNERLTDAPPRSPSPGGADADADIDEAARAFAERHPWTKLTLAVCSVRPS